MPEINRLPSSFRKYLKNELCTWEKEGIVKPETAAAISQRYDLESLSKETSNMLVYAIYIVGALLIGGGIISLVASHWEKLGNAFKVILIVSIMLAFHITGYYLWQIKGTYKKLGHTLIFLGTLVFGANIGLMAQIFHIHSNFYNGFGAWAFAAVVMAYVIWSVPNMMIAIVTSFIWFCGWVGDNKEMFQFYPILAAVLFLPFAYLRKSVTVVFFTALAISISIMVAGGVSGDEFKAFAISVIGVSALLLSWGIFHDYYDNSYNLFGKPLAYLGIINVSWISYILSFKETAQEMVRDHNEWVYYHNRFQYFHWVILVVLAIAVSIVLLIKVKAIFTSSNKRQLVISCYVCLLLLLLQMVLKNYVLIVVIGNIACALLAAGAMWNAVLKGDRSYFWYGILLLILTIVSRFFEYETDLLLKAAVLLIIGFGVLYGGLIFERYLKKEKASE